MTTIQPAVCAIGAAWRMLVRAIVAMTWAPTRDTLPGGAFCRLATVPVVGCPVTCMAPEVGPFVPQKTALGWPGGRSDNYCRVSS